MGPPPKKLRWVPDPDDLGARILPRRSIHAFYVIGMLWNLILPHVTTSKHLSTFALAGFAFALLFAFGLAVSLTSHVFVRFERDRFRCGSRSFIRMKKPFEHLIADIQGFAVAEIEGTWKIFLVTRGDARLELPFDLDGLVWRMQGSKKALAGAATADEAQYVADALFESLEVARHAGGEYRIAGATPELRVASDEPARTDDEAELTRKRGSR